MNRFLLILSMLFIPFASAEDVTEPVQTAQLVQPVLQKVQPAQTAQTVQPQPVQAPPVNPMVIPQNINFDDCTKIYSIAREKLFYLTLAAISANQFNIDELQSSNGYIIFSANRNKYLATIAGIDDKNAILKITPCNNVYKFPPGIIVNTFKYIDLNLTTKI